MKLYPKYDPKTYYSRDLYRKVCETNDLRIVWAKFLSNKKGLPYEEFLKLCTDSCPICESKLDYGLGKNNHGKQDENTPSCDRIIPPPWGDYVIDNVEVICERCNRMKNDATKRDVIRYERIAERLRHGPSLNTVLKEQHDHEHKETSDQSCSGPKHSGRSKQRQSKNNKN